MLEGLLDFVLLILLLLLLLLLVLFLILSLHLTLSLLCEPLANPPIADCQATWAKGNRPGLLHQGGFLPAELCFVALFMFLPEGGWPLLSTLDLRLVPGLALFSPRRTGRS